MGCAAFAMLAFFAGIFILGLAYADLVSGLPSLSLLPQMFDEQRGALLQPTQIYDRSGQKLLLSLENPGISRRFLSVDQNQPDHFSPQLVRVTLGVVEPGYWNSLGFRLGSLLDQQPVTIAERLVDDLLLWQEPPGLRRALRMRLMAAQVIARYGHVQVLEWYLNSAYYGHLAFGAESAARLYLNKSAAEVDLAEAALLAAAGQAPALNPLDAPSAALERQHAILDRMLAAQLIGAEEYRQARAHAVQIAAPPEASDAPAAAFTRLVLSMLGERFDMERLERGGLRIITTLDYSLQLEISCLARTQLVRLTGQSEEIDHPDGSACLSARLLPTLPPGGEALPAETAASAAILDPTTGQVLALLGDSTAVGEGAILTPRVPGSLLSPFAAVASFARGSGPASLVWDIPSSLPADLAGFENPDGMFHGPVRLRMAIANDYLASQVQLLDQVGAANVWRLASAFGLGSLSEETDPGLLFRGARVSSLELAQSYAVFAAQGQRMGQRLKQSGDLRPAMVLYMEDLDGNVWLDARQPESQSVVTPQLAYLVHHVLSDATARWPSLGYPNPLEIGRPSGAKIGQVEGGKEVWTAGYTPQRVAVFWLGLPEDSSQQVNPRAVAGMWHAFMQYSLRDLPPADWAQPAGITRMEVCDPSGMLPTTACPQVVSEVFLNGTEPTVADTLFRVYQVNRETGRLATVFTPAALVEEKIYMVPPSQAGDWAASAGLPVPPQDYDAIQPPQPSPLVEIISPDLFAYVRGKVSLRGSAAGVDFKFYQIVVGQGLNPESWLQVGSDGTSSVVNGELGVWDTQGQDGLYAVRLQVVRQDQSIETATIQVTVDNIPPVARVTYPTVNQTFDLAKDPEIIFQAETGDAIGVRRLIWLVDGVEVHESAQPPYALSWRAVRGKHVLEVRAVDPAGNEGVSEQVSFTVE